MFTASDQMLQCPPRPLPMDRRWKSSMELAPNCPRCASSNTKFCYYNNYSLSQPRYFCKGCRRYWTKGGSLRNVPVGGGCRRNRRGKSVRVPPTDQVLVTCSRDLPSSGSPPNDPSGNSCSSNGNSTVQPGSADIDLAMVFAKFLNQNSSSETEFVGPELPNEANTSLGLPNTLSSDVLQEEIMIECEKPLDLIGENELLEGLPLPQVFVGEKQQEERIQELLDHDPNALGLQTLLGDEVVQEALWSDASTLQNFTWQPVVQFQEFESIPSDDQLRISTFPISDYWSSFDMSGFEVFLRP